MSSVYSSTTQYIEYYPGSVTAYFEYWLAAGDPVGFFAASRFIFVI